MDSVDLLEKWRRERPEKVDIEPIEEQKRENEKATGLIRQLQQLAEYSQEEEVERGRD